MTDEDKKALAHRGEAASARSSFDVLLALQDVCKAQLAKGPGIASTAWRKLHDIIAETLGEEPLAQASPVAGTPPVMMPPGYEHPIPAKGGAVPVRPDQGVLADIRNRPDVAAELERQKRGGKP